MEILRLAMTDAPPLSARARTALSGQGVNLTPCQVEQIAAARNAALAETERVEFGAGTMDALARSFADSPFLQQDSAGETLAEVVGVFYAVRDDAPLEVPDEGVFTALRAAFDAVEGDADALDATSLAGELRDWELAACSGKPGGDALDSCAAYSIADDAGRVYRWDPADWEYDEFAPGWNGEGWADDLD